jgi:hypothetical protein
MQLSRIRLHCRVFLIMPSVDASRVRPVHEDKTRLIEFGRFAEENRRRKGGARPEVFDFLACTQQALSPPFSLSAISGVRFVGGAVGIGSRKSASEPAIPQVILRQGH